jgi:hypothetical protein
LSEGSDDPGIAVVTDDKRVAKIFDFRKSRAMELGRTERLFFSIEILPASASAVESSIFLAVASHSCTNGKVLTSLAGR